MTKVKLHKLGIEPYTKVWDFQKELFQKALDTKAENRKENTNIPIENHLIICQHKPVYTIGKSGNIDHLLINQKEVELHKIERGGDITFHGPGQIVGYPIFDLEQLEIGLAAYIHKMEEAIRQTLLDYNIKTDRVSDAAGVWLDTDNKAKTRKICAIGVKSSRWVTMHGFAFNVNTDLAYFNNIVPCGISDKMVTSLQQELGAEQNLEEVTHTLLKHLCAQFVIELE